MPNLIVILFNLMYSIFFVGFLCMGCVWERVWKLKTSLKIKGVFTGSSQEDFPRSKAMCSAYDWNVKSHDRWWQLVFASISRVRPACEYFVIFDTPDLYPHYIYSHYSHIERSAFQRENPNHNPWELKIGIPTILYTIQCGFPQLLPLHIKIIERLIAQILTTPIMSVKWGFGAVGKHWKKPFVWWMQSGWIAWSRELEKIRFR